MPHDHSEEPSGKSLFISIEQSMPICLNCGNDYDVVAEKQKDCSILFKIECPLCRATGIMNIDHIHMQKTFCCDV